VPRDGTAGLFLVQGAGVVSHGARRPGYAVLFVPGSWLLAAPPGTVGASGHVRLEIGRTTVGDAGSAATARSTFRTAGQRFDVVVARSEVRGAAALLPWVIAAAGLALAALTARVGVSGARRARSQREADRIFALSPDLIAVSGFDGRLRRINPAFERALGYPAEKLVGREMLDVVHPDDREDARGALESLMGGDEVVLFESRAIARDGAERWLEWNARPVVDEGVIYAAARDVTDRRLAEAEVRKAQQIVEAGRDELRVLADEQAALRRVATLVARNVPPSEVFRAVSAEANRLLEAHSTVLVRFEADGTAALAHDLPAASLSEGARLPVDGENVTGRVMRTGRSARVEQSGPASGPIAAVAHTLGVRVSIGAPIVVEGRLWGVLISSWAEHEPPSGDTGARLDQFAELVSSAIANADRRAELMASRARVLAAADDARRRVVRDLHDGAQQRLVHAVITLKLARRTVAQGGDSVDAALAEALEQTERANVELRELAHGILPAVLTSGGLRAGVNALVHRLPIRVAVDVAVDRLPPGIEASAYFVIAEALTNVAKHAQAERGSVKAWTENGSLHLEVTDDGLGGADAGGTGLLGLADRVASLGGRLRIESPPGDGTVLRAVLPLG
jgi:PAS domain S-box-containing protein